MPLPSDSPRPRLLVSVRSVDEAVAALEGGADVVDVKEPARGPLGRADDEVIAAIVETVKARSPGTTTSAAHGELAEWCDGGRHPVSSRHRVSEWPDLMKIGLAGTGEWSDWRRELASWRAACGGDWVGVVYADWRTAGAPSPRDVVDVCLDLGCAGVLFDTFDKRSGTLLDALSIEDLESLNSVIRSRGGFVALAGRLGIDELPSIAPLRPDVVGIRSAACEGADRGRNVRAAAVRRFVTALAGGMPPLPGERAGVRGSQSSGGDSEDERGRLSGHSWEREDRITSPSP